MDNFNIPSAFFKILAVFMMSKELSRKQKERVSKGICLFLILWGLSLLVHEMVPALNNYINYKLSHNDHTTQ